MQLLAEWTGTPARWAAGDQGHPALASRVYQMILALGLVEANDLQSNKL